MNSVNHQFMEFSSKVFKRYVRTTMYPIGGKRLNPRNTQNTYEVIDFLLATSPDNYEYTPQIDANSGSVVKTDVKQVAFDYNQEVLELYSEDEYKVFQRLNKELLSDGALIEYDEEAPVVDFVNTLSDADIKKLVRLKTKSIFEGKIKELTSVRTLKLVMTALEETDAPMSYAKIVRERENELNKN